MPRKLVIVNDPGIDGAYALSLAMLDPELDLLGVAAAPGNVSAEQATRNVHALVEHLDPPRWPRIGAALSISYDVNGEQLHGPNGLGGVDLPCARLHHPHPADKLISDLVRQFPGEVTVLVLGPATTLALALDRDPELPALVKQIVLLGGSWREPGNASAVAEFHFYCDPPAARQVLRCGAPILLITLDVMRRLVLSPRDLVELPAPASRSSRFLAQLAPCAVGSTARHYGIEGFHLKDAVGVAAVALPSALTSRPAVVDVEVAGELTRGMSVFDQRWGCKQHSNVEMAMALDSAAARGYVLDTLARGEAS